VAVDYNDRRFQEVNEEKQNALNNVNNMYNNMINNSDKYYNDQIKATEDYGNKQAEIQQANTDFAIEKIEQQKDWAKKDYTKEQKGAYNDWQKQSNQYGTNAEVLASQGLTNTGYSESSQVNMYNTYQNRVATARESFTRAITEYDNSIKDAQLANNSALAEIAYQTLQTKLSLSLQGFQYKNGLLQQQLQAQNETEDRYYTRWKGVLDQINTENALAEQQRQFNLSLANSRTSSSGGSSNSGGEEWLDGDYITTAFYQGQKNPDAQNGTFSNGYQPNNIGGDKLVGTGQYINKAGVTREGTKTTSVQQIWKTSDGKKWYWDGNQNKYIQYKGGKNV